VEVRSNIAEGRHFVMTTELEPGQEFTEKVKKISISQLNITGTHKYNI